MAQISFNGNIGGRVEVKELGGKPAVKFSVAEQNRRKNNQTGHWEDGEPTWYNVTAFGRGFLSADALAAAIDGTKAMVTVSGRMEVRTYEKDGQTRTSHDVTTNTDSVGILAKDGQGAGGGQRQSTGGYGQTYGREASTSETWGGGQDTGYPSDPPF